MTFDDTLSAIQCTLGLAAAILDLLLPVTSDNVGSMNYMSSELSDLGIMRVAIEISTVFILQA